MTKVSNERWVHKITGDNLEMNIMLTFVDSQCGYGFVVVVFYIRYFEVRSHLYHFNGYRICVEPLFLMDTTFILAPSFWTGFSALLVEKMDGSSPCIRGEWRPHFEWPSHLFKTTL